MLRRFCEIRDGVDCVLESDVDGVATTKCVGTLHTPVASETK